ncbi:hypothetical protein EI94DRAFT_1704348 [Lactarius quietus]|nr:hypothetical protein EI94DRAFT_1704348 [Lactarius quietus]
MLTSILETGDVDEDASNKPFSARLLGKDTQCLTELGSELKVYAERVVVPSDAARAVQVRITGMPLSNQEVFCDMSKWAYQQLSSGSKGKPIGMEYDAFNRAQEEGIGGVGRKAIAALEQVPGEIMACMLKEAGYKVATYDEKRSQCPCVSVCMVKGEPTRATEGDEQPISPDEETSHTCAMINTGEMNHACWHLGEKLRVIAYEAMENVNGTARSCGRPATYGRLARNAKSGALLRYQPYYYAGHKADYHRLTEVASVKRGGLTNDWADTISWHDAPAEEGDSGSRRDHGLEGEKVPTK